MTLRLLALPLFLCAAPALAQPAPEGDVGVSRVLTDPATADRLAGTMQALSKALLDLPVGQVQAAAEGRTATPEEQRLTVRDIGRRDDPDFEANLQRQIAGSRAGIQAGMKAMSAALPALMKGMAEAARELEKATANLPSPNYPKQ